MDHSSLAPRSLARSEDSEPSLLLEEGELRVMRIEELTTLAPVPTFSRTASITVERIMRHLQRGLPATLTEPQSRSIAEAWPADDSTLAFIIAGLFAARDGEGKRILSSRRLDPP